jgi:hypothetical protein
MVRISEIEINAGNTPGSQDRQRYGHDPGYDPHLPRHVLSFPFRNVYA